MASKKTPTKKTKGSKKAPAKKAPRSRKPVGVPRAMKSPHAPKRIDWHDVLCVKQWHVKYTRKELCAKLGVSRQTLYAQLKKRDLLPK